MDDGANEAEVRRLPPVGNRLFQISETDLAELEHAVPRLVEMLSTRPELLDNRLRAMIRRVQRVIVDVRWNYGPPSYVERIPADPTEPGTPELPSA